MKTKNPFITGLKIELEQKDRSFESSVRGWKEGELLLVDTPGEVDNMQEDVDINCSLHRRTGSPATFSVRTIGMLPEYNITVLTYPEKISGSSPSVSDRLNVTFPVNLRPEVEDGKVSISSALITDISMDGCQIKCENLFTAGDRIVISGAFPGMDHTFEVTGEIRVGMKTEEGYCAHGVLFTEKGGPGMKKLQKYIDKVRAHIFI